MKWKKIVCSEMWMQTIANSLRASHNEPTRINFRFFFIVIWYVQYFYALLFVRRKVKQSRAKPKNRHREKTVLRQCTLRFVRLSLHRAIAIAAVLGISSKKKRENNDSNLLRKQDIFLKRFFPCFHKKKRIQQNTCTYMHYDEEHLLDVQRHRNLFYLY